MASKETEPDKGLGTRQPFLFACAAGAITIAGLIIFKKYLTPSNAQCTNINNKTKADIEKKHDVDQDGNKQTLQNISNSTLLRDSVYSRLQSTTKPTTNVYCQYASNQEAPFVTAINLLVEYISNDIIHILFQYIPNLPQDFDVNNYLQHGWQPIHDTLHDYPNIYVENTLPIKNQPSLILTIGLPGSGKSTWANIRSPHNKYVVAADDYFDKFNDGRFEGRLLDKAHSWAQQQVHNAIKCGETAIANNTNTTLPEMHAYIMKVLFGQNIHKIVFAVMPEINIQTLVKRGIHGVPHKKCVEMLNRMNRWMDKGPPSSVAVLKAGAFKRYSSKNISKDVIYTGIFMDKEIQNKIRRYFISVSGKPLLCNLTDCHLTLKYQPLNDDVERLSFGKKVYLKIIGYGAHEYVQCFIVDILDDSIRRLCRNKYPHISVSFNKSYVRPNYSNELLYHGNIIPVINNFDVINTDDYNALYRNTKSDKCGGLIVEGVIGAFYYNRQGVIGGLRLQRSDDKKRSDDNDNVEKQKLFQNKKKRRRRRDRNKNKHKNKDNNEQQLKSSTAIKQ